MRKSTKSNNTLRVPLIFGSIAILVLLGGLALGYLSLKTRQYELGERMRQCERSLREVQARNEDYASRIATLSSRTALRRSVESGFIAMVAVPDTAIARLAPATLATDDGMIRTAATQVSRQ